MTNAEAAPRRLQVRLLRRLPALPPRLRGRAPRRRGGRRRSSTSSRPRGRSGRAPTTSSSSRAPSRRPTTPSGSTRSAARRASSSRSGRARRPGDPGPAQQPGRRGVHPGRLRLAPVHRDAEQVDADRRPRLRRLRAARLPGQQGPARRGPERLPERRKPVVPTYSVCLECKRRGRPASWSRTARPASVR